MSLSMHTALATPSAPERRSDRKTLADLVPFRSTPHYERICHLPNRATRAHAALCEILKLMELPEVVWQLKGKLARGGYHLMPEDDNTPPEMAAKLAYTELETLRLRLTNLVMHPPVPTVANPNPMNCLFFSADEEVNILHAIRREADVHLDTRGEDETFHELRNLCQLALGNLQQMRPMLRRV